MSSRMSAVGAVGMILLSGFSGCGSPSAQNPPSAMVSDKGTPVAIADLPPAVVDGVQKAMPGAQLAKAKKTSDGNYHLSDVKLGKQEYMLTVSPDGTILKKEDDDD